MFQNPFHRAIYLTGPTASGKTAIGVALAQRLDAEVIALDSMTLYRGMDIGTAKPTLAERGGIPHHLIDVIDPWEAASVAAYRGWAKEAARQVEERGKRALFVGGTALYLKALLRGLFEGPAAISSCGIVWSTTRRFKATKSSTGGLPNSIRPRRLGFTFTTAGGSSVLSR